MTSLSSCPSPSSPCFEAEAGTALARAARLRRAVAWHQQRDAPPPRPLQAALARAEARVAQLQDAARQSRLATGATVVLYHQTSAAAARAILLSGHLLPGRGGRAGAGCYFATTPEGTALKARRHGVVLECAVTLGMCRVGSDYADLRARGPTAGAWLAAQSVDSVAFETRTGWEVVVYRSDQVHVLRALV